jgi:predicted nucleotide-binding protein
MGTVQAPRYHDNHDYPHHEWLWLVDALLEKYPDVEADQWSPFATEWRSRAEALLAAPEDARAYYEQWQAADGRRFEQPLDESAYADTPTSYSAVAHLLREANAALAIDRDILMAAHRHVEAFGDSSNVYHIGARKPPRVGDWRYQEVAASKEAQRQAFLQIASALSGDRAPSDQVDVLREKVETLKGILLSRATGGDPNDDDYRRLRDEIRSHPDLGPLMPEWLQRVRTLDEWWLFIKTRHGKYEERRSFLSDAFGPAFSYLEQLQTGTPPNASTARQQHVREQRTEQRREGQGASILRRLFTGAVEPASEHVTSGAADARPQHTQPGPSRVRVFVVHGHDHGPRDSVARLLENLNFQPVILEEQPDKGRTIIEKFEDYADVQFAIVVMTPDDMGAAKGSRSRPRARQNVILELGFFIGKLERNHVAALVVGDIETPSDVRGVLYTRYDNGGAWKTKLAREMKAAELPVDMNLVH